MKNGTGIFITGVILILISTPLAYALVNILYQNQNLAGEYVPILNGFIHSLMLVGSLISVIGGVVYIRDREK
jgi:hypothetical protein